MMNTETPARAATVVELIDENGELLLIDGGTTSELQDYDTVRDARGSGSVATKVALILAGQPAWRI